MTNTKSTFEKYIENPERLRIFEQERLMVDALELLSAVMEVSGTKRGDLAEKLGRSKAYITQMFRGNRNLTLRTLADVLCVLNYRVRMVAEPLAAGASIITSSPWSITQRAGNAAVENEYTPDEFMEGIAA